jgi:hypothetical protein
VRARCRGEGAVSGDTFGSSLVVVQVAVERPVQAGDAVGGHPGAAGAFVVVRARHQHVENWMLTRREISNAADLALVGGFRVSDRCPRRL